MFLINPLAEKKQKNDGKKVLWDPARKHIIKTTKDTQTLLHHRGVANTCQFVLALFNI